MWRKRANLKSDRILSNGRYITACYRVYLKISILALGVFFLSSAQSGAYHKDINKKFGLSGKRKSLQPLPRRRKDKTRYSMA